MDETHAAGTGTRRARRAGPRWPGAARRRPDASAATEEGASVAQEAALLRERLRIAKDVHDLLVRDAGRAVALDDHHRHLRAVLDDEASDQAGARPGTLANLDAIVSPFVDEGLDVRTSARIPDGMPAVLDLHACRIVQEALDNVLRHSASRSARLFVAREAGRLVVEVTDPGPSRDQVRAVDGPATPHDGRGLVGIRERVRLLGGTVEVGPVGQGYRVRAVLPL